MFYVWNHQKRCHILTFHLCCHHHCPWFPKFVEYFHIANISNIRSDWLSCNFYTSIAALMLSFPFLLINNMANYLGIFTEQSFFLLFLLFFAFLFHTHTVSVLFPLWKKVLLLQLYRKDDYTIYILFSMHTHHISWERFMIDDRMEREHFFIYIFFAPVWAVCMLNTFYHYFFGENIRFCLAENVLKFKN